MKGKATMGEMSLFNCVKNGDLDCVERLLKTDSTLVHRRDETGATPLHYATFHGHRGVVSLLIRYGADVNARDDRFGATPAGWAMEYLRELGGLLAIEVDDLAFALMRNDPEGVARLLGRFPKLRDAITADGTSIRELALKSSNEQIRAIFDESRG